MFVERGLCYQLQADLKYLNAECMRYLQGILKIVGLPTSIRSATFGHNLHSPALQPEILNYRDIKESKL